MSQLRQAMSDYLTIRRSLGFELRDFGIKLRKFIDFMDRSEANVITMELIMSWVMSFSGIQTSQRASYLSVVRQFASYFRCIDARTEVPPPGILPYRPQRRAPHIYTDEEVSNLLAAASRLGPPNGLRPYTYSTFFGLLAVAGLRVGEALNLHRDAVDLDNGLIVVRFAKFGKTRLVPLDHSTIYALQGYATRRDRVHPVPVTPYFFVAQRGGQVDLWSIKTTFIELSRQIGLRGPTANRGPRLHDFRHSFAVRTLLRWYQAGQDVQRKLPVLSTYLGHTHPSDTYWYLSATPELMSHAATRLEKALGGLS